MKHELLAPAGNMESLKQAVANGADAVYIGCKDFGARKFAENFTPEEIVTAIKLCHLYGVKIYATMNTLVKDNEVPYFLGQIEFLHKNGIDAVLIQDFGMICLVREKYPNLEVHASTQANTSCKETAELFYNLGVKRVVFSREMTLQEIEAIKVPIEKEVFIHGALCTSYSGCCLMSSMLGGRSGNRGECAGCCRLPYSLLKGERTIIKDKYLLSTKELNTSTRFKELIDSDITSFKIEGRMKSPEYVGFVTSFYRKLIDNYGINVDIEEENDKLKTLFNRGFTLGHLFNSPIEDIMNPDTPNHIGLEIGRVVGFTDKKIKIRLSKVLNQQDGIRFLNSGKGFIVNYLYDEQDNLISSAYNMCYVDNKVNLEETDIVCKTQDYKLLQELKQIPARKVPITLKVIAKRNQPLEIQISDGFNSLKAVGTVVQQSVNAPMDDIRIRQQVEKLGETPFVSVSTVVINDPDIFIPIKELNELRRNLTTNLMNIRMNQKKEVIIKDIKLQVPQTTLNPICTAFVYTEEQLEACNSLKVKRIYVEDETLYNKYKMYENVYYKLPHCRRNIADKLKRFNIVSDYFDFSTKENLIGDYGLNVTNIYTAYYLYKRGLDTVTLSVELNDEEIINFINTYIKVFKVYPRIEILAYGQVENMLTKGNILNIKEHDYQYNLLDSKKRKFPVYFDGENTHILNHEMISHKNIETLKKYASIRLNFYKEDRKVVKNIVNRYR